MSPQPITPIPIRAIAFPISGAGRRRGLPEILGGHTGNDELNLLDARPFGIDVVGYDSPASHHDDTVGYLEDMMDVVRNEDAGMAGVASVAHEPKYASRLRDAQVVGRLIEDYEFAVEIHRSRDRHRLALAARQRADRRVGRDVLADADLLEKASCDLVHGGLIEAVEQTRPLDRLAPEKQVSGD